MSKSNIEKYRLSKETFKTWRQSFPNDPIHGYCNWEWDNGSFKLECYLVQIPGKAPETYIFQFFPNQTGFLKFTVL